MSLIEGPGDEELLGKEIPPQDLVIPESGWTGEAPVAPKRKGPHLAAGLGLVPLSSAFSDAVGASE